MFIRIFKILSLLILLMAHFVGQEAHAQDENFQSWLADVRQEALSLGISETVINASLTDIAPKARIIELDRKQPEGTLTFREYRQRVISSARIRQGREMMRRHAGLLNQVSRKYNVQPQYIVALWGIETSYGNNTGGFDVVEALATLAYDGRRGEYFRKELFNALRILNEGHIAPDDMKGSWAGAMGQNQFMPSSFFNFAVDGNGDGRRDIWQSLPDVFASTANYLSKSGWQGDERWGRAVKLPSGFETSYIGADKNLTLDQWQKLGVRTHDGRALPNVPGFTAGLIAPDGLDGPAFLVYDNFHTIMKWNRSHYFATSVGLLADSIAGF